MSRSYCYQCFRAEDACLCGWAVRIDNSINVIVLQHPDEVKNAKGSAVIAKLCLEHYQCWQGEDFSLHHEINQLIATSSDKICVLYPSESSVLIEDCLHNNTGANINNIEYVIFIDATWRKAKKIWQLSKNLHHLTTVKLDVANQSNYRIRKVPADGYLSTVEAITNCLAYIDQDLEKYQPMLDLFDEMIDYQIKKMGKSVYESNYQNNSDSK